MPGLLRAAPIAAAVCAAAVAGAAPVPPSLPDGNALVQELLARQRQVEDRLDDYTYDVRAVREELDGGGRVEKRVSETFESFHVKGRRVERKVAENGRPLSPEEQAEEDRRVREKAEAVRTGRTVSEQPRVRLSLVLERYDFETVRREWREGRKTLVLEFAPRPGSRREPGANVLRQLAGTVWVDEEDRQVVKAELHSLGTIKIERGFGTRIHDLRTSIEFRKIDGEVWLPVMEEMDARGRVFFVKRFRTRRRREYGGFRRFEVTTTEEPGSER